MEAPPPRPGDSVQVALACPLFSCPWRYSVETSLGVQTRVQLARGC